MSLDTSSIETKKSSSKAAKIFIKSDSPETVDLCYNKILEAEAADKSATMLKDKLRDEAFKAFVGSPDMDAKTVVLHGSKHAVEVTFNTGFKTDVTNKMEVIKTMIGEDSVINEYFPTSVSAAIAITDIPSENQQAFLDGLNKLIEKHEAKKASKINKSIKPIKNFLTYVRGLSLRKAVAIDEVVKIPSSTKCALSLEE